MTTPGDRDAIVIGSGCGSSIVEAALDHDWKVALIDRGPLGGTCMNVGCIPSKMLISPADRIMETRVRVIRLKICHSTSASA